MLYLTGNPGADNINECSTDFTPATGTSFSPEEESLYARRYEEKYDLYDPKYEEWLAANYPEASHKTYDKENAVSSMDLVASTPNRSTSNSPKVLMMSNATPNYNLEKSAKRSPLSDLLNSEGVRIVPPKPKIAKAQVLTSIECMRILKEKQDKKQREAEEKENRKKEREAKKELKEAEKKRKAEERAKAASQKAKKGTSKHNSNEKVAKEPTKRTTTEIRSTRKKQKIDLDESIESDLCCVCFGSYDDDLDTTRHWVQCQCGKWLHEDCIDEDDSVLIDGKLCPLC